MLEGSIPSVITDFDGSEMGGLKMGFFKKRTETSDVEFIGVWAGLLASAFLAFAGFPWATMAAIGIYGLCRLTEDWLTRTTC